MQRTIPTPYLHVLLVDYRRLLVTRPLYHRTRITLFMPNQRRRVKRPKPKMRKAATRTQETRKPSRNEAQPTKEIRRCEGSEEHRILGSTKATQRTNRMNDQHTEPMGSSDVKDRGDRRNRRALKRPIGQRRPTRSTRAETTKTPHQKDEWPPTRYQGQSADAR